jgi:RND family efflux transporter MFP subunit
MTAKRGLAIGVVVLFLAAAEYAGSSMLLSGRQGVDGKTATTTSSVRFVSSTVTADGVVTAQNQAKLNFQTSGKLTYLPFREGDKVSAGQTIAQLDTYQLQRQLAVALNNYRSTRDSFDQTQQNSQNNVLRAQQSPTFSKINADAAVAVDDAIKRIVDQNQANLDNSVVSVELANYALQLSRLNSPINGILTHADVTVSGLNITPATSFTVADPATMVFRANVPAERIYYVSEGSTVSLAVDGIREKIAGTVIRIYPSKVTLANGQAAYQVDIQSDDLKKLAKLDQSGRAIISTNAENVALVPAWTVLGGKYVWIDNGGQPKLQEVTVGKIHGNEIEVLQGLSSNDAIIVDPKSIPARHYGIL